MTGCSNTEREPGNEVENCTENTVRLTTNLLVNPRTADIRGQTCLKLANIGKTAFGRVNHGASVRVMLVEDEHMVLKVAAKMLERFGFDVLSFERGEDALKAFSTDINSIDILVTDVIMPGINGKELADRMLALRPNLKVLFTSGYTDNIFEEDGKGDLAINFLPKPYTPDMLSKKIIEVLRSVEI